MTLPFHSMSGPQAAVSRSSFPNPHADRVALKAPRTYRAIEMAKAMQDIAAVYRCCDFQGLDPGRVYLC